MGFEVFRQDGVDVAADVCATVSEDSCDTLKLFPYRFLDIDRVAFRQLGWHEVCFLEIGEIRFTLLLADALLFRCIGVSGVFCSSLNRLSDVAVLMESTLLVLLTARFELKV